MQVAPQPQQHQPQKAEMKHASEHFVPALRRYMDECHRLVDEVPSINRMAVLKHWDFLSTTLYPMVRKPGNWSLKQIIQFTMISQLHLQLVLPDPSHSKYSSLMRQYLSIKERAKAYLDACRIISGDNQA